MYRDPISISTATKVTSAVFVFMAAWMASAAWFHGIWIDEIWTLWMSRHDAPVAVIVSHRWNQDVHPPIFYAINWLFEPIVRQNVFIGRLLNFLPLAYLGVVSIYFGRKFPEMAKFVTVFGLLVVINPPALLYFAEYRSYYSQLCYTAAMLLALYRVSGNGDDLDPSGDFGTALILSISLIFALSLHYVGAIIVGTVAGISILDQVRLRHFRWAGLILASGFIAVSILAASIIYDLGFIKHIAADFWIKTDLRKSVSMIFSICVKTQMKNIVAVILATMTVLGIVINKIKLVRSSDVESSRNDAGKDNNKNWNFLAESLVALAVAACCLVALNSIKPIMAPRYLIPFVPIVAGVVAALSADLAFSRKWIFALFVLNLLAVGARGALVPIREMRWEAAAQYIRRQVGHCPDTRVYAIPESFIWPSRISDDIQVWGYQLVARSHGFKVQVLDRSRPAR